LVDPAAAGRLAVDDRGVVVAWDDGAAAALGVPAAEAIGRLLVDLLVPPAVRDLPAVVERSGYAVVRCTLDSIITEWNANAEQIYGWTAEEAIGRHISLIAPDAHGQGPEPPILRLLAGEPSEHVVVAERHRGGHLVHVALTVDLVRDGNGVPIGAVGISRDVTAEVRAERELAESEERFRVITEATEEIITLVRHGFPPVVEYTSPSLERVLGYRPEEYRDDPGLLLEMVHPDDREAAVAAFTRGERTVVQRVRHKDGHQVWMEVAATFVERDGSPNLVVTRSRDVTDRVRAEQAVRTSEERFRSLVQFSSDVALVLDGDGSITFASPASREVLGYTPEQVVGLAATDLIHPDDVGLFESRVRSVSPPGGDTAAVFRVCHRDGTWRWAEAVATNLADEPSVAGVVVNLRDVTGRVEASLALQRSEQRYRRIVETAEEGIWVTGRDDRTVFVNSKMAELLGSTVEAMAGRRPSEFLVPTDEGWSAGSMGGRGFKAQRSERCFVRADGSLLWALVSSSPLAGAAEAGGEEAGGHRVGGVLAMVSDISDRKRAEEELAHLALHDGLTGLPNRTLFLDRLTRALAVAERHGSSVAALFLDLDNFKLVNDSFGHDAGDGLLREVATRLSQAASGQVTIGRFGGDEFVVLCEDVDEAGAIAVANLVVEALRTPVMVGEVPVFVTTSVGIAVSPAVDALALLRDADAAMYEAKELGRARWAVYDNRRRGAARDQLRIHAELRRSLERGELVVFYQPVMDLQTGAVLGAEALVRWQHPVEGLLAPVHFIGAAEAGGLIIPMGAVVLRAACKQTAIWRSRGFDLHINVNLSAFQLADPGLVEMVAGALGDAGLPAAALTLEVTESAMLRDVARTDAALAELKALGVSLVIDDFGTGYSSLSYLQRFPMDGLKIDRSFVSSLDAGADGEGDAVIVAAVQGIAAHFGLSVVAEGVERPAQLDALRQLGCTRAQGYLWSKPLPAADFEAWLVARVASSPPARSRSNPVPAARPAGLAVTAAVLAAVGGPAAVLDAAGRVLVADDTWLELVAQGSRLPVAALGENLAAVCDSLDDHGGVGARRAGRGLRAVLSGARPEFSVVHPEPVAGPGSGGSGPAWYRLRVQALDLPGGGVLVTYEDVSEAFETETPPGSGGFGPHSGSLAERLSVARFSDGARG